MAETLSADLSEKPRRTTRKAANREEDASLLRDSLGWITILIGIGLLLMLVSYDPSDPSYFNQTSKHRAENLLGPVGAFGSDFMIQLVGFGSYLFPFFLIYLGIQLVRGRSLLYWYLRMTGGCMIWFAILVVLGGFQPVPYKNGTLNPGGTFGIELWVFLTRYLNPAGTYLLLVALCGCALMMATQLSLAQMGHGILRLGGMAGLWFQSQWAALQTWWQGRAEQTMRENIVRRELDRMGIDPDHVEPEPPTKKGRSKREPSLDPLDQPLVGVGSQELISRDLAFETQEPVEPRVRRSRGTSMELDSVEIVSDTFSADLDLDSGPRPTTGPVETQPKPKPLSHIPIQRAQKPAPKEQGTFDFVEDLQGQWVLPNTSFFNPPKPEHKIDEAELVHKAQTLENKFNEFGVTGEMKAIHPGPVVTTYEFRPDAGIKYSKVVNLQDDLCLALGAESVRIDRMPGRYSIGLEVPNTRREIITFREMVEHGHFRDDSGKLLMALGKTIDGTPYYCNLASMPHLLIAGQTGSGKSVGINAMICSILMRAAPDEVKFIMIDPKMVEMGMYADIPHLLTPVVVDPQEASNALKWAVFEMEQRYKLLATHSHRNLELFNRAVKLGKIETPEGEPPIQPLPFIVVVIDELADLMMVARGEVEESIARIAQKSRAVGIHLILATQRPSVDIITGVIKSNLPSRLSYRVAQRNDSRIILDGNGAEKLLGKGDGLFLPPGTSRLVRIHAPFLAESEIQDLIKFLKHQGKPQYQHQILKSNEEMAAEGKAAGRSNKANDDPMYDKAARLVVSSGQASVSYLQRKLGLGFARAAKLVDMMEEDGIVGPNVGSKPRDILVPGDYFDEVDARL
ncbi:MAG: DNA translocase FtsK [Acidobacteria bacterium]|nr:DNA translocase FtsK [Acidobacteriota bacterium]